MPPVIDPDRRYSVRQAAVFLGVGPQVVHDRIARGALPATQVGGEWRIAGADILARLAAGAAAAERARNRRAAAAAAIDPAATYSATAAARAIGVVPTTVCQWIGAGRLPATKRGRCWQIRGADLLAHVEADGGGRPG